MDDFNTIVFGIAVVLLYVVYWKLDDLRNKKPDDDHNKKDDAK